MNKHIAFIYRKLFVIISILNGIIGCVLFGWIFIKNINSTNNILKFGLLALVILCLNSLRLGIKRTIIANKQ